MTVAAEQPLFIGEFLDRDIGRELDAELHRFDLSIAGGASDCRVSMECWPHFSETIAHDDLDLSGS